MSDCSALYDLEACLRLTLRDRGVAGRNGRIYSKRICYVRFWQPERRLDGDGCLRKKTPHIRLGQDGGFLDHFCPDRKFFSPAFDEVAPDGCRIEPPKRHAAVSFNRKPFGWRLDPVRAAETPCLMREFGLLVGGADMFDHTIAEHDVKRSIGKSCDLAGVAFNIVNPW